MRADSIQDSTRYVVSDVHHGSILPGKRSEMRRNVFLLPGADVKGAMWCNRLEITGPGVRVEKSVYSLGAVAIKPGEDDTGEEDISADVTLKSCITSADSIVVYAPNYRARFESDIYAKQVTLDGAVVYGNIFAERIQLRNSVVLGGVFASEVLVVENAIVGTFKTKRASLGHDTSLLLPYGLARDELTLASKMRILTFAQLGSESNGNGGSVHADQRDVFTVKIPTKDKAANEKVLISHKCISLSERILDTTSVIDRLKDNVKLLTYMVLGNHMDPSDRSLVFNRPASEIEERLWDLIEEPKRPDEPKPKLRTLEDLRLRMSEVLGGPEKASGSDERG